MKYNKIYSSFLFKMILLPFGLLTFLQPAQGSDSSASTSNWLPEVSVSHLGTAQISYPIDLPPGFAPGLSLSYDSEGGDGMVGIGWSLAGLSQVVRNHTPSYNYDTDEKRDVLFSPDGILDCGIVLGTDCRARDNPNTVYIRKGMRTITWIIIIPSGPMERFCILEKAMIRPFAVLFTN